MKEEICEVTIKKTFDDKHFLQIVFEQTSVAVWYFILYFWFMDSDNREANHISPDRDFHTTVTIADESADEQLNEMASLKRQNALIKSTDNVQQEKL